MSNEADTVDDEGLVESLGEALKGVHLDDKKNLKEEQDVIKLAEEGGGDAEKRKKKEGASLQSKKEEEGDDGVVDDDEGDGPSTLRTVAKWLSTGQCSNVLILSGAGVSVSAGIPDFRTPGTGLYDNLQKYNLPFPEAVFDVGFYRTNPQPFLSLAQEIWPTGQRHFPTVTHSFVKLLEEKGLLLRNYTQNIDGLEVLAGVSPDKVLECHGHFRTASCIECKFEYDGELCKEEILNGCGDGGGATTTTAGGSTIEPPSCPKCTGYIKPDIVFFGEGLPEKFYANIRKDITKCDLLIVMGTSLMVAPVSMIPDMVDDDCPRVLLNRELVGNFQPGRGGAQGGNATASGKKKGKKKKGGGVSTSSREDIFEAGDCDNSVRKLCQFAGWLEELEGLHDDVRNPSRTT